VFISKAEYYHEGLDIVKSIDMAFDDFWAKEEGWEWKKKGKTLKINWTSTIEKALKHPLNQVKKQKTAYK
jgi:hypothetical protein